MSIPTAVTTPSAPPTDLRDFADRLRPIILRLGRRVRREAQRAGLSALDAGLLTTIRYRAGIGVSALAELERMTRPAMSEHIRRLEEAGWIRREDPEADADQRRVGLLLTEEGNRALDTIRERHNDWLMTQLAALPVAEQQVLYAALGALAKLAEAGK
jgi:DNA-binding MarR family transcriptional regulator